MSAGNQNKDAGHERGKNATSKEKDVNQLQKDVERGKAPKEIDRFDKGVKQHNEQIHVHFKDDANSALNKDGSWKHGLYKMNQEQKKYLKQNGWKIED